MPTCGHIIVVMSRMVRTQIQLSEEQLRYLKDEARAAGVSLAAFLRQVIDKQLEVRERHSARVKAIDALKALSFSSGIPDLARKHDDYLNEGRW